MADPTAFQRHVRFLTEPKSKGLVTTSSCSRSPTGQCFGWHKLSETDYKMKKSAWEAQELLKKLF